MSIFKQFWLQYRNQIAYILHYPTIIALSIFMIDSCYTHISRLVAGYSSLGAALYDNFCFCGTIITPLLAFRVWSEIFHPEADAVSFRVQSPIWGGVFTKLNNIIVLGIFPLILLLAVWRTQSLSSLTFVIEIVQTVTGVYLAFVYLPMLIIGFILHYIRPERPQPTPWAPHIDIVEVDVITDEDGNVHLFMGLDDSEDNHD